MKICICLRKKRAGVGKGELREQKGREEGMKGKKEAVPEAKTLMVDIAQTTQTNFPSTESLGHDSG